MGNINEMAGVGVPIEQAKALVGSKSTATPAGSTNADATLLGTGGVQSVTGADGAKGVILNDKLPVDSSQIIVNLTAAILKIYPPSGGSLNGLTATTAAVSIAASTSAIVVRLSATAWAVVSK